MLLNEFVAEKLEKIRKEKKIGVYTLCNKAAISYETYRSIRRNKNKDIYLRTLLILLRALDYPYDEFFRELMIHGDEIDVDFK